MRRASRINAAMWVHPADWENLVICWITACFRAQRLGIRALDWDGWWVAGAVPMPPEILTLVQAVEWERTLYHDRAKGARLRMWKERMRQSLRGNKAELASW
eukprot:6336540-Alexandrium_andersonii.AAC.1